MRHIRAILGLLTLLALSACVAAGPGGPAPAAPGQAEDLARAIAALGPDIAPEEAERAARTAYARTYELAQAYQITDPPLVHNTKVNMGLKPRGLCRHWAEDMESGLAQQEFSTLTLHRAIANAENPFRIEHSTVIISRRGAGFEDGIVLDPWRKGGVLTWVPTREDDRYAWQSRETVLDRKRQRMVARGELPPGYALDTAATCTSNSPSCINALQRLNRPVE